MKRYLDALYIIAIICLVAFCFLSYYTVNKLERSTPRAADTPAEYEVRSCIINDHRLFINGWIAPKGGSSYMQVNVYVVTSDDETMLINKRRWMRHDVAKQKNATGLYETSGFVASTSHGKKDGITNKVVLESISDKGIAVVEYACK